MEGSGKDGLKSNGSRILLSVPLKNVQNGQVTKVSEETKFLGGMRRTKNSSGTFNKMWSVCSIKLKMVDQLQLTLSSDNQAQGTSEGTCMNLQRKPSADWEEF